MPDQLWRLSIRQPAGVHVKVLNQSSVPPEAMRLKLSPGYRMNDPVATATEAEALVS